MSHCDTICPASIGTEENVIFIDIREPSEYAREHIPGAKNIPQDTLSKEALASVCHSNDRVVFYCQSGNRTQQARAILDSLSLANAYVLDKGLNNWKQQHKPTQINRSAPLPIMRQVQIIVGFMVLLGIVLAYLVSPGFMLISAFFGAGLLFAGVSGTCGLAKLLMLLPYNN